MESILKSIKKLLGIQEDYTHFDQDIILHINAAFMVLNQLGVGPETCFYIEDDTSEWEDFLDGAQNIEAVKTYIYLKVRLLFPQLPNHQVCFYRCLLHKKFYVHCQAQTLRTIREVFLCSILSSKFDHCLYNIHR